MSIHPMDTKELSPVALSNLYTMGIASQVDPRQAIPSRYVMPDLATRKLRAQLILEEAEETINALGFGISLDGDEKPIVVSEYVGSMEGAIDGCADLIYVAVGTLCAMGVPDERHLKEVCRANNDKFPQGKATVNENGKFGKPPGWRGPEHIPLMHYPHVNLAEIAAKLIAEKIGDGK